MIDGYKPKFITTFYFRFLIILLYFILKSHILPICVFKNFDFIVGKDLMQGNFLFWSYADVVADRQVRSCCSSTEKYCSLYQSNKETLQVNFRMSKLTTSNHHNAYTENCYYTLKSILTNQKLGR